jgi:hypothetical protein
MNEKGMRTLLQAAFAYERKLLRKLPAWGGVGLRLFTLLIFVTHFGLTLVYVAPINPIKIALQPILHNTIGHYFGQNWSFFAPNPISSNMSLMVRPLNRGEMTLAKNDVLPKDGWYDLTAPMWERFQHNRFSAYERLSRPQSNGLRMYLNGGPELTPWMEACKKGDADSCRYYEEQMVIYREKAVELLTRIASGFAQEVSDPRPDLAGVALRIRVQNVAPWSQRFTAIPEVRDTDLGVYPLVPNVAQSGLFRRAPEGSND